MLRLDTNGVKVFGDGKKSRGRSLHPCSCRHQAWRIDESGVIIKESAAPGEESVSERVRLALWGLAASDDCLPPSTL